MILFLYKHPQDN